MKGQWVSYVLGVVAGMGIASVAIQLGASHWTLTGAMLVLIVIAIVVKVRS